MQTQRNHKHSQRNTYETIPMFLRLTSDNLLFYHAKHPLFGMIKQCQTGDAKPKTGVGCNCIDPVCSKVGPPLASHSARSHHILVIWWWWWYSCYCCCCDCHQFVCRRNSNFYDNFSRTRRTTICLLVDNPISPLPSHLPAVTSLQPGFAISK